MSTVEPWRTRWPVAVSCESNMTQAYSWQLLEQSAQAPQRITSTEQLQTAVARWLTLPHVAIDTEFQRVDTFYPIAGLIQIADDSHCYLIDPLEVADLSPLISLFSAEHVVKIVHAGSEDLELFDSLLGALPRPLFDTQYAASFLGWGYTMGLQRLLERELGVVLGKGETTSNWLQRPLSANQERYAALDVAYLAAIYSRQRELLEQRKLLDWFYQDSRRILAEVGDTDPEGLEYYRRFSQMWNLSPVKLVALRELTAWREQCCRERNVPRNRILRNQTLLAIITQWPKTTGHLANVSEMRGRTVREDGAAILEILKGAADVLEATGPAEPIDRPLAVEWNARLKKLKSLARRKAEQLDMAPELMLRRKDLELLVRSRERVGQYCLPEALQGWREAVIGVALLELLQSF